MTAYRRDHTPGATWFFTLNLADRQRGLLTAQVDLLRASFARVMRQHPWRIEAIVFYPITCTPSVPCRPAMPTLPCAGA
jgi:putative transposase